MAGLKLPARGDVYLDSNCVIYIVERIEPYAEVLSAVCHAASAGRVRMLRSALVLLEVLVKPLAAGDSLLIDVYRDMLLDTEGYELVSLDEAIAQRAAEIRSRYGLKTPDAIHASTALECGAALFVTNDPTFSRVAGLPVTLLSEALQS